MVAVAMDFSKAANDPTLAVVEIYPQTSLSRF
jgi:hypothetical protein